MALRRGEQGPHRGVGEQQRAVRTEHRDGVFEVLDDGLERGALADQRGAIGGEPRTHRLERVAEVAEVGVGGQIDVHVELAAPEPRQPAA